MQRPALVIEYALQQMGGNTALRRRRNLHLLDLDNGRSEKVDVSGLA